MKTKDLIRLLQEADPTGEAPCCVGNCDIIEVHDLPAYYDGCAQQFIYENDDPQGKIIGARRLRHGSKVSLRAMSIHEFMFWYDAVDLPVEYGPHDARYREADDKGRQEARDICNKCERDSFGEWVKLKVEFDNPDCIASKADDVKAISDAFYNANMSYDTALPDDLRDGRVSFRDRRFTQWDREYQVTVTGDEIQVAKQ